MSKHPISILFFFLLLVIIAPLTVSSTAQAETIQDKLNRAFEGVIKAAGKHGPMMICETVLPDSLCKIVVEPVLSALFFEAPQLEPKESDTSDEINKKTENTINYLHSSEKLQRMMIEKFNSLEANQEKILIEIERLGRTQNDINFTLRMMVLEMKYLKDKHNLLIDKIADLTKTQNNDKVHRKERQVVHRNYETLKKRIDLVIRLYSERENLIKKIIMIGGTPSPAINYFNSKHKSSVSFFILKAHSDVDRLMDRYNKGQISEEKALNAFMDYNMSLVGYYQGLTFQTSLLKRDYKKLIEEKGVPIRNMR